ncbi:MAG: tRNA epoxyqueuosine(34) reductase QueG, partial [Sandaracinobacteroides sp.]
MTSDALKTASGSISERLEAQARALGFVAVGIVPATAAPQAAGRLHAWLAEGRHADMLWMEA